MGVTHAGAMMALTVVGKGGLRGSVFCSVLFNMIGSGKLLGWQVDICSLRFGMSLVEDKWLSHVLIGVCQLI